MFRGRRPGPNYFLINFLIDPRRGGKKRRGTTRAGFVVLAALVLKSLAGSRTRLPLPIPPRNRLQQAATADLTPPAREQQRCCPRFLNTSSAGKPFTSRKFVDAESGFASIGARAGDKGRSPGCMDDNRGPSRRRIQRPHACSMRWC